jgi:hypothetical protein
MGSGPRRASGAYNMLAKVSARTEPKIADTNVATRGSRGLQVFHEGRGRVRVTGARKDSAEASALKAWLAERIDVVRFEQRIGSGAFYADYDDGIALSGRFIRGLRDKIHSLNRTIPEPFDITPVHSLRGRVRLRVTGITEQQLATLTMLAAGLPGVKRTGHLPGGRTMLVVYDPEKVNERLILAALLKSDPAEWAREWHEPTPTRWAAALFGTSTLIVCLTGAAPFPLLAMAVALNTVAPLRHCSEALRQGKICIDLLDIAATFAALATGRPITAAFVVWMIGVGNLLLDLSANQARSALSMLMGRGEQEALQVLPDGGIETVSVGELRAGDDFMVRTGQAIVADGRVVSGSAEVDGKALTGESRLVSKK